MRNSLTSIWIMCLIVIGGFAGFITLESDVASSGTTIYVGSGAGNDSATINGGISLAGKGDTVYVYGGTYIENVIVDKAINLIGENRDKTIIDGGGSGSVVRVTSNGVNIIGFNITSGDFGINLLSSSNNNITCNNIYLNNRVGIFIDSSYNNIMNNNISLNNGPGIYLFWSSNNNITGNNLSNNYYGIYNNGSSIYNIITNNKIFSNIWFGILLVFSSNYNLIMSNKVSNNGNGIYLFESSNNLIYYNSLIDNTKQAYDNTNDSNQWDNGYPSGGNFWSDYGGIDLNSTPAQDVPPPDDIGDTPYVIDSDSQDNYPLMEPMVEWVLPLQPPVLYINVSQDGRDIILYWDPPPVQDFDPYLIYRSTDPNNFNFSTPWINTLIDKEPGELKPIPDRTMWNDTNAAFPGNKTNYKKQYYYLIRAFNDRNEVSRTSRTVGKWTKTFSQGVSTFSLPLEPLQNITIDYCLNDMNAEYIKWMHPGLHMWMKHGNGGVNDTQMRVGEGYEVKFSNQTNYTFTGFPGAMISYDDDSGFSGFDHATEAKNLTVTVEPNGDVNLTWQKPSNMSDGWYEVYFSNTRDGFFGTFNTSYFSVYSPVNFGNNSATHVNALANQSGARLYYMVVPFNASGIRGSSTYSIGIWTEEYLNQYDTFGIPLKLNNYQTADWYHDNIPNTVGINYYIYSEQRWCWHSARMPAGAYDPVLEMTVAYQISTSNPTKFTFIGV